MSDEKDPTQDDNQENLSTEQDEGGGEQEDAPRFSPVVSRGAVADPNAKKKKDAKKKSPKERKIKDEEQARLEAEFDALLEKLFGQ